MQDGEDNLYRGDFFLGVQINRNATTVVDNRNGVVLVDGNLDMIAKAGKRFVYRVVDDLVHQMVEAARTRRADVHARAFAHSFKALQNLDVLAAVVGFI